MKHKFSLRAVREWIDARWMFLIVLGAFLVMSALLSGAAALIGAYNTPHTWLVSIAIELIAAAIIVVVFGKVLKVGLRADTSEYAELQRSLLRQMKMHRNPRQRQQVLDELMMDDLLQTAKLDAAQLDGAFLEGANLEGANMVCTDLTLADLESARLNGALLHDAMLRGARLTNARMRGADLERAVLEDAVLANAILSGANLRGANLRNASLLDAELEGALLVDADLAGANLRYANLRGSSLAGARFDAHTVLPDGTTWTADTDLRAFTDAAHPGFASYAGPDVEHFKARQPQD